MIRLYIYNDSGFWLNYVRGMILFETLLPVVYLLYSVLLCTRIHYSEYSVFHITTVNYLDPTSSTVLLVGPQMDLQQQQQQHGNN
jgi:hypothetical protein